MSSKTEKQQLADLAKRTKKKPPLRVVKGNEPKAKPDTSKIERPVNLKNILKLKIEAVDMGKYKELLGNIERNTTMMAYGPSGSGKSVFILMLVNFLAALLGKVIYLSREEKQGLSLQERIKEFIPSPNPKVQVVKNWTFEDLMIRIKTHHYRVVVIDSVQYMKFTIDQLAELREVYSKRKIIIILVSFGTGVGSTDGANKLLHASDVKLFFKNGTVHSHGRYIKKPITKQLFTVSNAGMQGGLFE